MRARLELEGIFNFEGWLLRQVSTLSRRPEPNLCDESPLGSCARNVSAIPQRGSSPMS